MDTKINDITEYYEKYFSNKTYTNLFNLFHGSIDKLHNLIHGKPVEIVEDEDDDICIYVGLYYETIKEYELAEKYYSMTFSRESTGINCLADMYKNMNKLDIAKNYYLTAISNNCVIAMYKLAKLYSD